MDFLVDDNDGYGLQSSFLIRLAGWGIQYNHVEFFDLKTDLEPNLQSRRTLRLNRGFGRVFLELSAEQKVDTFDVTRHKYGGRLSGNVGSVLLTTDIEANLGGGTEFTRGNLLANGRIHPKMLLRAGLNYEVSPEVEVRSSPRADRRAMIWLRRPMPCSRIALRVMRSVWNRVFK